jgi:hypothetical protein
MVGRLKLLLARMIPRYFLAVLAIAEEGSCDEQAGKGTRGHGAFPEGRTLARRRAQRRLATRQHSPGRSSGQDFGEIVAAVDAGVLFEHPEQMEVGSALV